MTAPRVSHSIVEELRARPDPDASRFIRSTLNRLRGNRSLSEPDAMRMMALVLQEVLTVDELERYLVLMAAKGVTADELVGSAKALRAITQHVTAPFPVLDNCGTGGDGLGTFNISTAAALVVAATGQPVAKHGNRSSSGGVGSADVLVALGIPLYLDHDRMISSLKRNHFAFLFAPYFRPNVRSIAEVRRRIGGPTLFNLAGPLCNPAYPVFQVIGTYSETVAQRLAEAALRLGTQRTFVVAGPHGIDELIPSDENIFFRIESGASTRGILNGKDAGLPDCTLNDLKGGNARQNATLTIAILAGQPVPQRSAILMNAGVALLAAGCFASLREACEQCERAIEDGRALRLLNDLRSGSP